MVVLSVICGVLLMMGGIACLFNPGATFFATGYFIAILLLIYGIVGIVNVVRKRAPAIGLITYILAVIVGIFAIFRPENALVMDTILAYLVAAWFVIQGIVSIYMSIKAKPYKSGWVCGLILGILAILIGLYSFFHPMLGALTIGILVGIYLIDAGLSMIVFATAVDSIDGQ